MFNIWCCTSTSASRLRFMDPWQHCRRVVPTWAVFLLRTGAPAHATGFFVTFYIFGHGLCAAVSAAVGPANLMPGTPPNRIRCSRNQRTSARIQVAHGSVQAHVRPLERLEAVVPRTCCRRGKGPTGSGGTAAAAEERLQPPQKVLWQPRTPQHPRLMAPLGAALISEHPSPCSPLPCVPTPVIAV